MPAMSLMMPPGVVPNNNPIQGDVVPDSDEALKQQMIQAGQLGQQTFSGQLSRAHDLASRIAELQQQQTAQPMPQPWSPQYEPVTGGKSFLRDAGKGILHTLSLTGPGASVEHELYQRKEAPYQQTQAMRAAQIAQMQEQMGAEQKPLEAAAQLQYRPYMAQAAGERGQAALLNAQTNQVKERHFTALRQQSLALQQELGRGKLSEEAKRTKVQEFLAAVQQDRNNAIREVAGIHAGSAEAVSQVEALTKEYTDQFEHPWQQMLGTGPTPPVTKSTAKPRASATPSGSTHILGGSANGLPDGTTGNNGKYVVKGGKWQTR
jgi:hypothetical protein